MRNAFSGYSYQKHITLLLLSIMDVERNILKLEIEAKTDDDFDDLILTTSSASFQLQVKDFSDVSIDDLKIEDNIMFIKGKAHMLSTNQSIIFFNKIDIPPNEKFLNFPCYKFSENIFLISLSRVQIDKKIDTLYNGNAQRKNEIDSFFNNVLDKRVWEIPIESLPQIKIFITKLQEKSVLISHKLLEFENLLLIEGKPGVGKSHFVNALTKEYENNIVYRFWIGNQDNDYNERLKFENFIRDLNAKLFNDQKSRNIEELCHKLKDKTFIIDGLDHIENYNKPHLEHFINFIEQTKEYCKLIVLSRPLATELTWKKHTLENWNVKQTQTVLEKLFHLSGYSIASEIYDISQGYPIIVKYLAEHYKVHQAVPDMQQVDNIDAYYQNIISDEKGKHSLSVFLCCSSYIMQTELRLFIGDETEYVEEFIKEHPYLFDIKLNRIALLHDSFNTFLKKQVNYKSKSEKISQIISLSILNLEKRFLSRFGFFQLSCEQKKEILVQYASIDTFENLLGNTIDFEALRAFYDQLREALVKFSPQNFTVGNYYDLSLIFNLVARDHISADKRFYYTYVQSLIENGIMDEDITSSDYLFGMYYYVKTRNATLLLNRTANDNYDVERFHRDLEYDVIKEERYIKKHSRELDKRTIDKALKDRINFRDHLIHIIENIFIHQSEVKGYKILKTVIAEYLNGNNYLAINELNKFLAEYDVPDYYPEWILQAVRKNLISYGYRIENDKNEFQDMTLAELISRHAELGSFNLQEKIHSHIRLALNEKRKIDIESIYPYWTKYYQRKDYTLYALPVALKALESEGFVSLKECINLIHEIQEVSEKGYRHLLSEFMELYAPSKIIPFIEKNFNTKDLRVDWFKLPTRYINKISERTYNAEENELFRYHRDYSFPLEEVENVLHSNKFKKLEFTLNLLKSKITYKRGQQSTVSKFEYSNLRFEEQPEERNGDKYKKSSSQRFNQGFLNYHDKKFIRKLNFQPEDITKFSDGNYTSLPEIDLFKIYEPEQVTQNFEKILYNSVTGRTKSTNYFYSLYYHPGNVLAMIKLYRAEKEFKCAVKSFEKFLSLSMFNLKIIHLDI